jgi:hypothetical protein
VDGRIISQFQTLQGSLACRSASNAFRLG